MGRASCAATLVVLVIAAATRVPLIPAADAAPLSPSTATPPSVAVFGDSIAHSAEPKVRAALANRPIVMYDAVNATTTSDHLEAVTEVVGAEVPPEILVIELGTNDAATLDPGVFERDVRALLDVAAPRVDCIRWLDQKPTGTFNPQFNAQARLFNRLLYDIADEYPNVETVHYGAWTSLAGPSAFLGDGLHPNGAGRREFARLVRQAADGCDPTLASGPLWDVLDTSGEAEAVRWLASSGIVPGARNRTFRGTIASLQPPITRGQWMTWLWRLAGAPVAPPAAWSDVVGTERAALDWAASAGIVAPPPDGRFQPASPLNRWALAKFAWRYAEAPVATTTDEWLDISPSRLAAVRWVTQEHLLEGLPGQIFQPSGAVTRNAAAVATFRLHLLDLPLPPTEPASSSTSLPPPPTTGPPTPTDEPAASATTLPSPPTSGPPTTVVPPPATSTTVTQVP